MGAPIKLRDGLVKIGDGGDPENFTAVAGVTEATLEISGGETDMSNSDSSGWEAYVDAGKRSASVTLAGIYFDDDAELEKLIASRLDGTTRNIQLVQTRATDAVTYQGNFIVTSVSDPIVATEGVVNYNISLKANGAITRTVA